MSLLITLEGIDGSGKSTLIKNLKKKADFNLTTHDWRDTELGQKLWHLLNEAKGKGKDGLPSNWSYIFLFLVAFDELNQKIIKPNLQANKVVVVDRYLDSTLVYQGLAGGTGINAIQEAAEKTIDLPVPDITFILDIDPLKAHERLKKRKLETGEYTNWDNLNLEFHHRIRNNYLELKKIFPERICIIDANQSEIKVTEEIEEVIKQAYLPKKDLPQLVRVIIHNKKGEVLVVKEKKWGCWNFPGGKIEAGETPENAARREVFEETNLVIKNCEIIATENIFFASLPKEKQHWKGYFFQTSRYSGEVRIKELENILAIKFVDYNSPEARESRRTYQKFFRKIP